MALYLIKIPSHKYERGGGGMAPCILNLGTRWGLVISFKPRPLLPEKTPRYPLDRRPVGLQSQLGRCDEDENLALPRTKP
jgi:hypothetical protein